MLWFSFEPNIYNPIGLSQVTPNRSEEKKGISYPATMITSEQFKSFEQCQWEKYSSYYLTFKVAIIH
jgi:hypothetical protein